MSTAKKAVSPPRARHVADRHDLIRVHGARVNNLKDVSVELPKRRLTVFTGVSGSGKSSLVFGTIAAESQRMMNETYSTFVQGFMPTLSRPDVDVLDGLTTAILVDQQRMGGDVHSTVGTATDANAILRILFSRLGKPHIGSPQAFSFNVASISGAGAVTLERGGKTVKERRSFSITGGMCPRCEGRGTVSDIDLTQLYDDSKSLNEGAITIPGYSMDGWYGRIFRGCGFFDPDKPIAGGTICFEGTVQGLRASRTITGRHFDDRTALKETVRTPTGTLEIHGADSHNLQDVDVDIPLGVLVTVTGVAGSGKSSLINGSVSGRDGVVSVDQAPIRGSRRSNPATYTGLLEPIRKAFAKANGVKPALFSANSEGACPTCNGAGVIYTDLGTMVGVATTCEGCEGKRFDASVLEYHLGGRDITEVLAMSVTEAAGFFGAGEAHTPAAHVVLERLADVGLGYLSLGQPLTTLSGGERQRLKLATHMGDKGGIYVLDEPTSGLHLADVEQLLGLLDRLVDAGKSVIVIEHHQAVMAHADWIIDLGPGAGHDGGRIVFEGTPADVVAARSTLTGEHPATYVLTGQNGKL